VFIASVNGANADQTIRATAAGQHVLCEKPLANTVDECLGMIAACKTNNVYLMTAYRKYFEPGSVALKRLITSGKLGRLRHIFSSYTESVDPVKAKWQLNRQLAGGGSLMDIGIYCVNTMRWLAGTDPLDATGQHGRTIRSVSAKWKTASHFASPTLTDWFARAHPAIARSLRPSYKCMAKRDVPP
jgi:predicted dehydrogenase